MYQYQHGGDIYSQKTTPEGKPFKDFSANINPLGMPKSVKKAIIEALPNCVRYPDAFCRELKEATAAFLKVPADYLFFGNGAADVLFRLTLALKPQKAMLLAPTFADYEKALRSVNCEITYYNLPKDKGFRIQEDILKKLQPDLDIVVICNPNNPTGLVCEQGLLKKVLERCQTNGTVLLIDECFMDFVPMEEGYSFRTKLKGYKNLVILKAFTKTFAMPGVRLGYCMTANKKLIKGLHEAGQDWNVSIMAQEAGKAAVQELEYLRKSFAYVAKQRTMMLKRLKQLPDIKVYDSLTNYIFFKLKNTKNLPEQLKAKGFLIRSCANYHNLGEEYYRIAVNKQADNLALLKALEEILLKEEKINSKLKNNLKSYS